MRCPVHVGQEMVAISGDVPFRSLAQHEPADEKIRVTLKCPIAICTRVAVEFDPNKRNRPRCTKCGVLFTRAGDSDGAKAQCPNCRKRKWSKWNNLQRHQRNLGSKP